MNDGSRVCGFGCVWLCVAMWLCVCVCVDLEQKTSPR